ncbi:MAG: hypothetical protein ACF8SC_06690 [Phycisphaerales bacterium JB037]
MSGADAEKAGEGSFGLARPRTPGELHAWLAEHLELEVPTRALIAGHASPFDYLCHAFFEEEWKEPGGGEFGGDKAGDGSWRPNSDAAGAPRDSVVWANRGGGKTFLGAVATLLDLVFKPGIAVRILGGSLEQSRRMHAHLAGLFAREPFCDMVEGRITQRRVALANGSACEVLAQSETSVRGTRVQRLRCDEVELFDPEVWEAAQLVTRSKQCGGVFVRGTIECLSTMHRPHGLMFRIVREASAGRRRLFKWGVVDVLGACDDSHECSGAGGDCPLLPECGGRAKERDATGQGAGHITVRDAMDLKGRVGEATWNAEMLSLRPSRSDAVYPEFEARRHVVSREPAAREDDLRVAGMDFGYRSPTVVLWATLDAEGVLWVTDEMIRTGELLERSIEALRARPVSWVGVDPAGRQRSEQTGLSNIEQMRRAGLKVRDRVLRLDEGIGLVRSRLRPAVEGPRLFVHERCAGLIEAIERYHYPADDKESMTPIKDGSDHACDALRYLVQNLDRPIRTRVSRYA